MDDHKGAPTNASYNPDKHNVKRFFAPPVGDALGNIGDAANGTAAATDVTKEMHSGTKGTALSDPVVKEDTNDANGGKVGRGSATNSVIIDGENTNAGDKANTTPVRACGVAHSGTKVVALFGPPVPHSNKGGNGSLAWHKGTAGPTTIVGTKANVTGAGGMGFACVCKKDLAARGSCGQGWAQRPDALTQGAAAKLPSGTSDGSSPTAQDADKQWTGRKSATDARPTGGTGKISVVTTSCTGHAQATTTNQPTMGPKLMISIPTVHISDISLCNIKEPTQSKPGAPVPIYYIMLKAWIEYGLKYSRQHNPVAPKDSRECIDDAFQAKNVAARAHKEKTWETMSGGKGFKMTFNVWVMLSEALKDDEYLTKRLASLDTAMHGVVQQQTWRTTSANEHVAELRVAHSSNNSTTDTPEFLLTCLTADSHGGSRQQLLHVADEFYRRINSHLPASYQLDDE